MPTDGEARTSMAVSNRCTLRLGNLLNRVLSRPSSSRSASEFANETARELQNTPVSVAHAVSALAGFNFNSWEHAIGSASHVNRNPSLVLSKPQFVETLLRDARAIAQRIADVHVGTEHLLAAMLNSSGTLAISARGFGSAYHTFVDSIIAHRPCAGWPRPSPTPFRDLTVLQDRPTWDTFLLHFLYSPSAGIDSSPALLSPKTFSRPDAASAQHCERTKYRELSPPFPDLIDERSSLLGCFRTDARVFPVGPVRIHAVGCTDQEIESIYGMEPERLTECVRLSGEYLAFDITALAVDVVCFGARYDRSRLPRQLQNWFSQRPAWAGLVSERLRIAFVDMAFTGSFRQTLIHELVHLVVLHALSRRLTPDAVNEGFAYAMEARLAFRMQIHLPDVWPSIPAQPRAGATNRSSHTRLTELFASNDHQLQTRPAMGQSYAAQVFLAEQNYPSGRLSGLLSRPEIQRSRNGKETMDFIASRLGISTHELNSRFDSFY